MASLTLLGGHGAEEEGSYEPLQEGRREGGREGRREERERGRE